jgi:hypothetical protein
MDLSLRSPLLEGEEAPAGDSRGGGTVNGSGATAAAARASSRPQPGKFANPLLSVCPYILVNELCERLAYNG